jgi:hypothetical protein
MTHVVLVRNADTLNMSTLPLFEVKEARIRHPPPPVPALGSTASGDVAEHGQLG